MAPVCTSPGGSHAGMIPARKDGARLRQKQCVKGDDAGGKGEKGRKTFRIRKKSLHLSMPTTRQGRLIPASYQTLWHPNGALINSCRNRYKGLHSFYSLISKATSSSFKKRLTVLHFGAIIPGTLFSNAPFKSYECRGSRLTSPDGWTSGYKGKKSIVSLYRDRQEKLSTGNGSPHRGQSVTENNEKTAPE